MGKLRRYHEDNFPYFVTAAVKSRKRLFADASAASVLRDTLESCRRRYGFLVLAYAILPDHLHAIIVPAEDNTISAVMRYIKGSFSRRYSSAKGTDGAVWQPRFHDTAIRSERELQSRIRYVEENPVRAGLVAKPDAYPFSSAHPSWRSDLPQYLGTG